MVDTSATFYIYYVSRFNSYINTTVNILQIYNGEIPLAVYLKKYFASNKKHGSKDRKYISSLCYNYFRLGLSTKNVVDKEQILLGAFLSESEPSDLLENIKPEWNKKITQTLNKKIEFLKKNFFLSTVFPFKNELSDGIEFEEFCKSFFIRPDVFLRIRPKTQTGLMTKLQKAKFEYKLPGSDCIELNHSFDAEDFFLVDKEVVVQDYNSQKVLDYFRPQHLTFKDPPVRIWDCCAGSGGKSILVYDIFNQRIELTVSDIRPNIILNLHQRFKKAGVKSYYYFISDLCNNSIEESQQKQVTGSQIIICDAPCTGSGTWSRTPEQLYFFDEKKIEAFTRRQKEIVSNAIPYLAKGGLFVYITCSVFKKENEEIVNFITKKFRLKEVNTRLLKGYDKKADSMFVSILKK